MEQTKLESLLESAVNISSGFFISLLVWIFVVAPLWDIPVKMHDSLAITSIFTVSSLLRAYIWRRFFNAGMHKAIHNIIKITIGVETK